jgi:FtsH-binding integral membrane protein
MVRSHKRLSNIEGGRIMGKHPNWIIGISYLIFLIFVGIAINNVGNLILCILASIGALIMLFIISWAMTYKGRSGWYCFLIAAVPLIGLIIVLVLPNKRTTTKETGD